MIVVAIVCVKTVILGAPLHKNAYKSLIAAFLMTTVVVAQS